MHDIVYTKKADIGLKTLSGAERNKALNKIDQLRTHNGLFEEAHKLTGGMADKKVFMLRTSDKIRVLFEEKDSKYVILDIVSNSRLNRLFAKEAA